MFVERNQQSYVKDHVFWFCPLAPYPGLSITQTMTLDSVAHLLTC